jgi:queuine/archaeosine tRNA-ribosyltransferase
VDTAVDNLGKTRWLILIYHLPREPSRHRVAVWRKLKTLGAIYLQDGVAVLPEDAVTREQFEWLQLRVREAGGEASLWEALPNTVAEDKFLVEEFRASREAAYKRLIEAAGRLRCKAALGSDIALAFDECTPFHVERDYTAASMERTHRWLDRCVSWCRENAPEGQLLYGIVQGGVYEDLRAESTAYVAGAGVDGIATSEQLRLLESDAPAWRRVLEFLERHR